MTCDAITATLGRRTSTSHCQAQALPVSLLAPLRILLTHSRSQSSPSHPIMSPYDTLSQKQYLLSSSSPSPSPLTALVTRGALGAPELMPTAFPFSEPEERSSSLCCVGGALRARDEAACAGSSSSVDAAGAGVPFPAPRTGLALAAAEADALLPDGAAFFLGAEEVAGLGAEDVAAPLGPEATSSSLRFLGVADDLSAAAIGLDPLPLAPPPSEVSPAWAAMLACAEAPAMRAMRGGPFFLGLGALFSPAPPCPTGVPSRRCPARCEGCGARAARIVGCARSVSSSEVMYEACEMIVSAVLTATRILSSPPILYARASSAHSLSASKRSPGETRSS